MVHAICVWLIFHSEITFIENICLKFTWAEKLKSFTSYISKSKELNLELKSSCLLTLEHPSYSTENCKQPITAI